jgi:hypothetical protein
VFGTIPVAVLLLGDDNIGVAVLAVGAGVLDAVITVFMAAIFVFSCHFFLWAHFPHPVPVMLVVTR